MNNQMQTFHNEEFGELDVLLIDGAPYFPATECAKILGYAKPENAIIRHCKGSLKRRVLSNGGMQEKKFIPEGDLYRLIIRSKLPAAARFEAWVMDEVLPSIRKHGAYFTEETLLKVAANPDFMFELLQSLIEERKKNADLEQQAERLAPKARYCDLVLLSQNAVPISQIAKDYGMSARSFNTLLHDLNVQYKVGGQWLLYQKYADQGYTKSYTYYVGDRAANIQTRWTQLGRMFLYHLLAWNGIRPMMEYDQPRQQA